LKRDLISFGVALNACQMQSLWLSALQLMEAWALLLGGEGAKFDGHRTLDP
jgi:hypothetical protein